MFLDWKNQHCKNDGTTQKKSSFSASPIKLPIKFFIELEQKVLQFIWNHERPWIAKTILRKKWSWRNQTPWLQTIQQNYSNQNSMVLAQNRNTDQWNGIQSPELNPCTYKHLIDDKGGENIQWRKDSVFNKCWENWAATHKRMK